MVQLPRERTIPRRTCGGRMGPAHKARDDEGMEFWNGCRPPPQRETCVTRLTSRKLRSNRRIRP
ncbi:hypothetical protein EIB18_04170 [Caulobacter vibrioides]|uniref:Uncharacterized protein n=1 Tax=Caulobacter vibrioides (strain NA1000 / CB15N) TaxID=565050 RepID=A0A0H3C7V6_CAUVN|nr:hypothetical protein [Caulobacter vibrioides]YP_002516189.1 hypothetical protein CCNA_00816 [Caulobacter vibrioides NA1000]ACL94281.1 hypothetical protein CCNA_00816 [Caulobacter vibrioides NA1000]ATC27618.1 hypothetical protein CA607_04140 [Caulobacter vibrioides]AZH11986.1 hypothetical protein EIB18_04170 [Caulobacter vibrioides]QXZ52855.1 hypothetical protein KZH45_04045 [Caulobacter vibrioides]